MRPFTSSTKLQAETAIDRWYVQTAALACERSSSAATVRHYPSVWPELITAVPLMSVARPTLPDGGSSAVVVHAVATAAGISVHWHVNTCSEHDTTVRTAQPTRHVRHMRARAMDACFHVSPPGYRNLATQWG